MADHIFELAEMEAILSILFHKKYCLNQFSLVECTKLFLRLKMTLKSSLIYIISGF